MFKQTYSTFQIDSMFTDSDIWFNVCCPQWYSTGGGYLWQTTDIAFVRLIFIDKCLLPTVTFDSISLSTVKFHRQSHIFLFNIVAQSGIWYNVFFNLIFLHTVTFDLIFVVHSYIHRRIFVTSHWFTQMDPTQTTNRTWRKPLIFLCLKVKCLWLKTFIYQTDNK